MSRCGEGFGLQQMDESDNNSTRFEISHPVGGRNRPLSPVARTALAVVGLLFLVGFGLAATVNPDPSGRGTHQQFGFPPCIILTKTNIPCPTCGMTTSFAHFVRGQWGQSAEVNTSGFFLAVCCLCYLPWSLMTVVRGRWWLVNDVERWFAWLSLSWLVVLILEWGLRNFLF